MKNSENNYLLAEMFDTLQAATSFNKRKTSTVDESPRKLTIRCRSLSLDIVIRVLLFPGRKYFIDMISALQLKSSATSDLKSLSRVC
jgi:hypothetical protein